MGPSNIYLGVITSALGSGRYDVQRIDWEGGGSVEAIEDCEAWNDLGFDLPEGTNCFLIYDPDRPEENPRVAV